MHFTVVFESHESAQLAYGLVFTPCPCWTKTAATPEEVVINLHSDNPQYAKGDIDRLLNHIAAGTDVRPFGNQRPGRVFFEEEGNPRRACIVVHSTGNGTPADLAMLEEDLRDKGFSVQTVTFGGEGWE